jgi:hypothetical protein
MSSGFGVEVISPAVEPRKCFTVTAMILTLATVTAPTAIIRTGNRRMATPLQQSEIA